MAARPGVLYLSADDVGRCLPSMGTRLELVQSALSALAHGEAEMPPKVGVHPRPEAMLEAMPAWWQTRDIVGMKWIAAYPGNQGRGLQHVQGLIVLNEPGSGAPICVMDAGIITALRTASVSVHAAALLNPGDRIDVLAVIGAGTQAKAHIEAFSDRFHVRRIQLYDRHPERAGKLADWAAAERRLEASTSATARDAVGAADVVLSCAGLGPDRQALAYRDIADASVVVAIDDDMYVSADMVAQTGLFIVDDRTQFLAFRARGGFAGFRDPDLQLGELGADRASGSRPVVVVTIGVGIADIVFANDVYQRAVTAGIGNSLPA